MPAPAANATLDGLSGVRKGMNAGIAPRFVERDQVAFAINATFRGGLPRSRPVFRKMALSYADETTRTRARVGLWQEGSFYQAVGSGESCLVTAVGGRLFRYLVKGGQSAGVDELSWVGELNDSVNPNCWMWQSEDFLIVQNGQANPLFFDGASVRRSLGQGGQELPPGCMGCYVNGRNWMVLADSNGGPSQAYMAGDLVYTHGFTDGYGGRAAVLATQELNVFSGGAPFAVPVSAGPITGMGAVAIADTSLGQGALQVMTRTAVFSVNVPLDRSLWFTSTVPLVVVGLPNYGTVGQGALVTVNGDLWYRSLDGIRSYQVGRRDLNTWVNTPLSVEVETVLRRDADFLLPKATGVLFNNRLLMSCAPRVVRDRGTAHWGLIALDFNNISNLNTQLGGTSTYGGVRSNPAYDGVWTGIHILKLVKGVLNGQERCFAFALDCDGEITLWELMRDEEGYFDYDGTNTVGIESSIVTRSMGWGDGGNALKRLVCADLYIERLAGNNNVALDFKYRSDEDPIWKNWHAFTLCTPVEDCATEGASCFVFENIREQYRTYLRLPDPKDTPCSPVTKRSPRTGYEFQTRMWWKGFLELNRLHEWAQPQGDSVVKSCPTSETCAILKGCDLPWFDYSVEGCAGMPNVPYPIPPGAPNPPTPPDPPPPPNAPPEWPVPPPYTCPGANFDLSPLQIVDQLQSPPLAAYVGIPGVEDPNSYVSDHGAPGCLVAWSNAVWADFVSRAVPYSQARLVWYLLPASGKQFLATVAFPDQSGGYIGVIDLDWKIIVEYCSPS